MSDDEFVLFEGVRQLHDKRGPLVTIQARGSFGLNRRAVEALGNPDQVMFMYNPKSQAIGIRAAQQGEMSAYPVRRQEHADSYVLNGRLFLESIEYPVGL